jgi:X-Pro dipeptidyl-peptidase-like protein
MDLYLSSDDGPFPVVVGRTPYNKNQAEFANLAQQTNSKGYALVVQDVRGRGDLLSHTAGIARHTRLRLNATDPRGPGHSPKLLPQERRGLPIVAARWVSVEASDEAPCRRPDPHPARLPGGATQLRLPPVGVYVGDYEEEDRALPA